MSEYIQVFKMPRTDIGRPYHDSPSVAALTEAIDECLRFSGVKDPVEIKRALLANEKIYTNFSIYSVKGG